MKDQIGDAQFRVMYKMWGVDNAIEAVKRMGMVVTDDQIVAAKKEETEIRERWDRVFK